MKQNGKQQMSIADIMTQQLEEMFTKKGWTRVRDEKPKERTYEIYLVSKINNSAVSCFGPNYKKR